MYTQTSASRSVPCFLKSRTSKTFPPFFEPSCHPSGWCAPSPEGSKGFPYTREHPRSCCHPHPSHSTGALSSSLYFGCGRGSEPPLSSIWCNSNSFWNYPPRLSNAQRAPGSLMLLFILDGNLGQKLIVLSQVRESPASWPGSQTVSILFLGNSQ